MRVCILPCSTFIEDCVLIKTLNSNVMLFFLIKSMHLCLIRRKNNEAIYIAILHTQMQHVLPWYITKELSQL